MLSSKEALKCIIVGTNVDTYRSSIEEIDEAIETIEKDLEVLEILKRMVIVRKGNTWYYLDTKHPFFDSQEDIDKVKEWLSNE